MIIDLSKMICEMENPRGRGNISNRKTNMTYYVRDRVYTNVAKYLARALGRRPTRKDRSSTRYHGKTLHSLLQEALKLRSDYSN